MAKFFRNDTKSQYPNPEIFIEVCQLSIFKGCRELEEIRREWGDRAAKVAEIHVRRDEEDLKGGMEIRCKPDGGMR